MDPKQLLALIVDHARGMWRFRWYALAVAWGLASVVAVYVLLLPDTYRASAKVYVDQDSILRPLLRGLYVETDVMSDVALMTRVMLSRPQLEEVIRETDMDLGLVTERDWQVALSRLEDRISIGRDRENVYTISYTDGERRQAQHVVETLMDTFVERTLGTDLRDANNAEQTLQEQIKQYEARLVEAEDRLKRFKQEHVGLMPGQAGDYYQQLRAAMDSLQASRRELRVAQEQRRSLQRQIEGVEPVNFGQGVQSPFDQEIAALQQRRNELLLEYTEQHPEVRRTEGLIAELTKKREALGSPPDSANGNHAQANSVNPVVQSLQLQLSGVNVDIARIETEISIQQAEVDRLRDQVDVIPEVEAELTRLNRDYEVVRDRYQQMVERWESLQTGRVVQSGRNEVTFQIIEPPYAGPQPVGPARPIFLLAACVVSIGAGLALALGLNLAWPVFTSAERLAALGLPVVGAVHNVHVGSSTMRFRNYAFAVLLAALPATVLGLAALSQPVSSSLRGMIG